MQKKQYSTPSIRRWCDDEENIEQMKMELEN